MRRSGKPTHRSEALSEAHSEAQRAVPQRQTPGGASVVEFESRYASAWEKRQGRRLGEEVGHGAVVAPLAPHDAALLHKERQRLRRKSAVAVVTRILDCLSTAPAAEYRDRDCKSIIRSLPLCRHLLALTMAIMALLMEVITMVPVRSTMLFCCPHNAPKRLPARPPRPSAPLSTPAIRVTRSKCPN